MSLNHARALSAAAFSFLLVLSCGQSDYQGGGRRTDLGSTVSVGIAIAAGGAGDTGGAESSVSAGRAGFAGCDASGDGGQSLGKGCAP